MSKKNIIIAGGGFSGLTALRYIKELKNDFNVLLVDKKPDFEFLPMLPDVVGGWMRPELLQYDLASFCAKQKAEFINAEIKEVNPAGKMLTVGGEKIAYEYLILATGSETNFYGNGSFEEAFYKLDNVKDAEDIRKAIINKVRSSGRINIIIAGGGYTGIEIATNVDFFLRQMRADYKIYIVEKADEIMTTVPEWIRHKVGKELGVLGIDVITGDSVNVVTGEDITFASGKTLNNALCIWAAGVRTPRYLETTGLKSERTRLLVEHTLRVPALEGKGIFAAGDTACFKERPDSRAVRMAVMFSIKEGRVAAENIAREVKKKPDRICRLLDLGYLVPMANGKAAGTVIGTRIWGSPGYFMHYLMCIYRSGWKNKMGILEELFKKNKKRRNKWKRSA